MRLEPWIYQDRELALHGELYRPTSAGNGKAVLVVHEADGIGGNVRRHCARLAELGYIAAAADMHGHGRVLDGAAMTAALETFKADPPLLRGRVRAALDALHVQLALPFEDIAAIGFCFGGFAVLELARSGAPIAAVASFHGLLTTRQPAQPDAIRAKVLAATGARDPLVPAADVVAFQAEMTQTGVDWHLLVHGRALHSYTNEAVASLGDPRMGYDAFAHQLSWATVTTFLANALAAPSS
jgi:dienelactone hydrolase